MEKEHSLVSAVITSNQLSPNLDPQTYLQGPFPHYNIGLTYGEDADPNSVFASARVMVSGCQPD